MNILVNGKIDLVKSFDRQFKTKDAAMAKHFLSHLPQSEWPYVCMFCGKHMQARSDLAKHFKTSLHANDPRIPKPGSADWLSILQQSQVREWPPKTKEIPIGKLTFS